jgi:hypothetical protein
MLHTANWLLLLVQAMSALTQTNFGVADSVFSMLQPAFLYGNQKNFQGDGPSMTDQE